jgi:hypothetical protein
VHDFLCTANEAALTTYNLGRTPTETIKRRLKKIVATETHRTATEAICVHNLGNIAVRTEFMALCVLVNKAADAVLEAFLTTLVTVAGVLTNRTTPPQTD